MRDYAFTRSRIFQWMGILLSLGIIAVGYWYFQVYAGYKTNVSPTGTLTSGLVGYWTFDGANTSSTTATDQGSGGNNGTLTNSPAVAPGKLGQALDFFPNGADTNARVTYGDPGDGDLDFGSGDFSISFWMKGRGYNDQSSSANVVLSKKAIDTGSSAGYGFTYASTNLLSFTMGNGSTAYTVTQPTSTVADSQWHHYVGFRSGSTNYFYVDGVLVGSVAVSGSASNSDNFIIGTDDNGGNGNTRNVNAVIDEVRVYNVALTAAQIESLYKQGQSDEVNTGTSQPQGGSQLDSGLAGYWKMDDGSGTSATDSSTNGNTGTLTNGPTWTTGQIGGAVDIDGSNDIIDVADANSLDITNTLTISAWIKKDSSPAFGSYDTVVVKGDSGAPAVNYFLGTYSLSGPTEKVRFSYYASATTHSVHGSTTLTNGTWYHIAVSYNDTANSFQMYVNGSLETLTTISGDVANNSMVANAYDLDIGSSNGSLIFDGQIDELRIYSRDFPAEEIMSLYRLSTPTGTETGLKGYWSFNGKDVSGTTVYDRSGAGNTGTTNGSPSVTPGKIGQALSFDGSDDYVALASNSSLVSQSAVTVSAWIKPTALVEFAGIVSKYVGTTNDFTFNLGGVCCTNASSALAVSVRTGSDTYGYTNAGVISAGVWTFVTAVFDGSLSGNSNRLKIYTNGNQQTLSFNGTIPTTTSGSGSAYIGQVNGVYFNGSIDEVRIYNRALSTTEIQSLYQQGQSDETNTGTSQPQGGSQLDSGLAGYWKLDDGSGTSATDSSTNGNTGTLTSGPTWTTGQIGGAVDFEGTDDYISIADSSPLDITQAITLSAWVKGDSWTNTEGNFILAKNDFDTVERRNYYLMVNTSGNLGFGFDNNSVSGSLFSTTTLSTGQWYFVAATYDRQNIKLYENGALVRTTTETDALVANTNVLSIGRAQRNNASDYGEWDGYIDEARIYNRALAADEVANLYRLTAPTGTETGLKGYWSFNGKDLSGTTAYDRSGAGNTGTTSGSPSVTPGKIGQGIALDGSDDYVSFADASSIDYDYNQDFSFSVWVKLPSTQSDTSGGDNFIIEKWSSSGGYPYVLRLYNQTYGVSGDRGKVIFRRYDGTNSPGVTSTSALNDNNWHHVVGTKSGSQLRIYVDGASQATATDTTTTTTTNTSPLYIGTRGASTNNLTGAVDEFRLYNRALSATEVAALYANR